MAMRRLLPCSTPLRGEACRMPSDRPTGPTGSNSTTQSQQLPQTGPMQNRASEISLLGIINALLRHRRTLIGLPLIAATAALIFSMLRASDYSAMSRFAPLIPRRTDTQLAGLAAQFGVSIGTNTNSETLEFYAELLKSHEL